MLTQDQIAEEVILLTGSLQLKTPTGWANVERAYKTVPLPLHRIETATKHLEAADQHLIHTDFGWLPMEEVLPGSSVVTEDGPQVVTDSYSLHRSESLYDFTLEGVAGEYFSNGILSHNSTLLAVRQRLYAELLRKYSSLYVAPHPTHLKTYANKFRELENAFRFPVTDHNFRQNLYYKEYPNGSRIELIRLLLSPDDARGKTVDEILIDEAAMFDTEFWPELRLTQKSSKMKSSYFAGTALTSDTFLAARFDESSQGQWLVPSQDSTGKKIWINCSEPDEIFPCIQQEGLICSHSGKLLRLEDGEYVHKNQQAYDYGQVGYHAPQLIIPDYVNDLLQWNEIYTDFKNFPKAKFLREVMGIPSEDGYREITIKDLENICVLPDTKQGLMAKAQKNYYQWVISGCDWGGSDYNPAERTKVSYTAQAIIGITPDRDIDILHMETWDGMHYSQIAKEISANHQRFRGNMLASDDGGGDLYNNFLQASGYILPEKHLVLKYTAPNTKLFARLETGGSKFLNRYGLNRTESISALFEALKRAPHPRIRCYNWGDARKHLMDFLNMYRIMSEMETGTKKFLYRRHGSKADDMLHAINLAFVTAKVCMNEPLIDDRNVRDALRRNLLGTGGGSVANPWTGVSG